MFEEMIITWVLGIIKSVVKNPGKAQALRIALLEIRDEITALYPDTVPSIK